MLPEVKIAEKYIKEEFSPLSFGNVMVSYIKDNVCINYHKLIERVPLNNKELENELNIPVISGAIENWSITKKEIPFIDFLIWWLEKGDVDEALDWYNEHVFTSKIKKI